LPTNFLINFFLSGGALGGLWEVSW